MKRMTLFATVLLSGCYSSNPCFNFTHKQYNTPDCVQVRGWYDDIMHSVDNGSPSRKEQQTHTDFAPDPAIQGHVTPNAYGLGVGMDQYGRPVTLQPAFPGGSSSGSYVQTPDAYGPGIHMDQ